MTNNTCQINLVFPKMVRFIIYFSEVKMEIAVKSGSPEKQRTACLVLAVFQNRKLSEHAEIVDQVSEGYLSSIIRRGDIEGHAGDTLLLHHVPNIVADRVLLVGVGKERDLNDQQYQRIIYASAKLLNTTGANEAVSYLSELPVKGRNSLWKIKQAAIHIANQSYQFELLKTKKNEHSKKLKKIVFTIPTRKKLVDAEQALREAQAINSGMLLTKNLANMPANICNPEYLAHEALIMSKQFPNIDVEVLDRKDLEELKMGAFLSVAKGATVEPKLIIFNYCGGPKDQQPIVLVGKGVTFDSGGISIKPSAAMDEMKYDMCGAASVFGVIRACAELQLEMNIVGIIPATENMPSGDATRPGDIVTSMSGKTIEILNTDAEGRLILCDALSYADRFNPHSVIDIATLTGACIIALGHHTSAVMGNHNPLINELKNAGKTSGDPCWELPLGEEYQKQLDSNFADIANIGGRPAGSITAACFLSRFTKKYHWAHLDIAGTAWKSGKEKGATGRPVPLLMEYILQQSKTEK